MHDLEQPVLPASYTDKLSVRKLVSGEEQKKNEKFSNTFVRTNYTTKEKKNSQMTFAPRRTERTMICAAGDLGKTSSRTRNKR